MKHLLGLAVAAIATAPIAAEAATIYATAVDYNVDVVAAGRGTSDDRANGANALGNDTSTFFEIGLYDMPVFTFGQKFTGPGTVLEVTYGSRDNWYEEAVVEVFDGTDWTAILNSPINNSSGSTFLDIGAGPFEAIRFSTSGDTKVSNCTLGSVSYKCGGFDIAALAVHSVAPVPLPAGLPLLAVGLGGLAYVARRRKG